MRKIDYEIIFPDVDSQLKQNEEWVIIDFGEKQKKVNLHDYGAIYDIPGLYEEIFCEHLECNSPEVMCGMLSDVLKKSEGDMDNLRVLDFGAGNGIVGEQIKDIGCASLVGVDILPQARNAVKRDRPFIYDDYHVMDMSILDDKKKEKLERYNFNCLITVGALGFDDIPLTAFLNAFNLIEDDGWIIFNIKDSFLTGKDDTGYKDGIHHMVDAGVLAVHQRKRYCHRLALNNEKLYYIGIVGKKNQNVNLADIFNIGGEECPWKYQRNCVKKFQKV
ncbi:MAG: methyltransferase domain-containing protein [Candidatus Poribacteria bacterium]